MPPSVMPNHNFITISSLTEESFRSFGTLVDSARARSADAVSANQGSALKIPAICPTTNLYHLAPSKTPAKAMTSMFVCSPRELRQHPDPAVGVFNVKILERHPYTTQTFVPLGLEPGDDATTWYLVIVCPSLSDSFLPSDKPDSHGDWSQEFKSQSAEKPAICGAPDLGNLKAFIARGNQAITYAAGTWHAPMVVLGEREVTFVVIQFVNEVGEEDCQEVEIFPEKEILIDYRAGGRAKI